MIKEKDPSPCLTCRRVADPQSCDNKCCMLWRKWFLRRWALIHNYRKAERRSSTAPVPAQSGKTIQTKGCLQADPCAQCLCPKDLCTVPCQARRVWEEGKKEGFYELENRSSGKASPL